MSNTDTNAPHYIQALLNRAREQLAEITPGPWGTGEHVDEPRAVCKEPQGFDNLLALDKDGMAIFERAVDAAFVVDVRNGLLAALCDALEAEHRRATEADACIAATWGVLNSTQSRIPFEDPLWSEIEVVMAVPHVAGRDLLDRLAAAEHRAEETEAQAAALREVLNKVLAGEGYVYEPEDGFELCGSKENAAACGSVALEQCRDMSSDGWPENTDSIEWGVMLPLEQAEEVDREDVDREEDPSSEFDYTCNYILRPTPLAVSIQAALDTNAGRALLERLAAAEHRAAEAESGRDEAEAQAAALVDALTTSIVAHDTPVPPESWHAALNTFRNKVKAGRAFLERLHAAEGQNLQAWEEISSLHHAAEQSAAQVKIVDLMLQDEPNPEDFRSRRILLILKERDTLRAEKTSPATDREALGQIVREVWIAWAKEQPAPKDSWLVPWDGLSEPDKEVDRRIGEQVAWGLRVARDLAAARENAVRNTVEAVMGGAYALLYEDYTDRLQWALDEVEVSDTANLLLSRLNMAEKDLELLRGWINRILDWQSHSGPMQQCSHCGLKRAPNVASCPLCSP
jgi:hypothetical protein